MLKILFASFAVNLFTSIDDALTRIPVLSASARSTSGRIAFSIGNLLAVTVIVGLAYVFSQVLDTLPGGSRTIAVIVLMLAIVVYFDLLTLTPPKRVQGAIIASEISPQTHRKLMGLGFIMTFVTMIDDLFALAPFFVDGWQASLFAILGIYASSLLLVFGVLYFSKALYALPHKRLFATGTLLVFAGVLAVGIL